MSGKKWIEAKKEVAAFRSFLSDNQLPAETPRAFLLTRDEIERILSQKEGEGLDGIRIYLGLKTINNVEVPTVVIVGAEKDEHGVFNDYNVPGSKKLKAATTGFSVTADADGDPGDPADPEEPGDDGPVATPMPCPVSCGSNNDLNP